MWLQHMEGVLGAVYLLMQLPAILVHGHHGNKAHGQSRGVRLLSESICVGVWVVLHWEGCGVAESGPAGQTRPGGACQHQPLPMMHGPPMELFVQKKCTPLGVLEVVQENTPMTWCHRMVISRKHNGDPRRTVDMQKLNDGNATRPSPHSSRP